MKHLIQEIKDLVQKPRLLLQYVVLNFFLISVGLAAVMYIKKEAILEHQRTQGELIINVNRQLDGVDLPPKAERQLDELEHDAQKSLKDQGVDDTQTSTIPKEKGSSQ